MARRWRDLRPEEDAEARYYMEEIDARRSLEQPKAIDDTVRTTVWIGGGLWLLVFALAVAALALGIWAVVVAAENRRQLNDAIDNGLVMRSAPTEDGHGPRWDSKNGDWVPGHGRMRDLEDVQLGSKKRPLEDGDILRVDRGRVVNARDRALEQELGHHIDTKFDRSLGNGHIMIRNETASQWTNAPLAAFLHLGALSDVHLGKSERDVPDGSLLERDAGRNQWVARRPKAQAWLRFCADPRSDPHKTWGKVEGLRAGQWSSVKPVSPTVGVYAIDAMSKGGLHVSRKHVCIRTVSVDRHQGERPSPTGKTYRLQARVTAAGLPPGAWGFLVGGEQAPLDGGFAVVPPEDVRVPGHWTIESVRDVQVDQEIKLAYLADRATPPSNPPRVQCLTMGVEEL